MQRNSDKLLYLQTCFISHLYLPDSSPPIIRMSETSLLLGEKCAWLTLKYSLHTLEGGQVYQGGQHVKQYGDEFVFDI